MICFATGESVLAWLPLSANAYGQSDSVFAVSDLWILGWKNAAQLLPLRYFWAGSV